MVYLEIDQARRQCIVARYSHVEYLQPLLLHQVLTSLFANTVEHVQDGARLIVAAPPGYLPALLIHRRDANFELPGLIPLQ
jgi:hypothetical protein